MTVDRLSAHRGLKWPTGPEAKTYVLHAVPVTLVFVGVYGFCNWLASTRSTRLHLYFPWELAVPLVPGMVYVYLSLNVLVVMPLFVLRSEEFRPLAVTMVIASLIAGAFFIVFPAELGFTRRESVPGYELVFALIHRWLLPHNLVPSLHITYSGICALAMARDAAAWLRTAFYTWLALICFSVVAVHQHHLLDVAGGLALAALGYRRVFLPRARRAYFE